MATLETRLKDAMTRAATECKSIRSLMNGNQSNNAALMTTAKNSLVDAINELYSLIGNAGYGDMMRSTYDANNNGKVDVAETAEAVAWANVTGKPTSFAPAAHDASLITSGTISFDRLPALPGQNTVFPSSTIASLTTLEQAEIDKGTIVATSDGARWLYKGVGSKTLEASYVNIGDVTPDWNVIANRPASLAGYGITDAQALDATLTALAGVAVAADQMIYANGVDSFTTTTLTTFARSLLAETSDANARTRLGLGTAATQASTAFAPASHNHAIADITGLQTALTGKQALDATLTALSGVTTAANQLIYATGADTFDVTTFTSFARSLLAGADAAAMRGTLQLGSAALADASTFVTAAAIGNPDVDLVATFNAGLT